jgi:membrane protease YdiL (CAAX protease family)
MTFQLRPAPIIKMAGVSAAVAASVVLINHIAQSLPVLQALTQAHPWLLSLLVHIPQLLIPLGVILCLTGGRVRSYGFNFDEDAHLTHRRVLAIGLGFGLLMSIKYIPQIVRAGSVEIPTPVTKVDIVGRMALQWVVVGISEETMFRGLIQTYLMNNLEGYVRIVGHRLHIGTVLGAVFWGVFHFLNVLIMPLGPVVFLVFLTTAIGLIMGYAYQRTGSLLTTIIMHSTIFGVPLTLGYVLYWML